MKMASVDPDFAGTDAFYEMCGLDAENIARIQAQKRQARSDAAIATMFGGNSVAKARTPEGVQQEA